MPLKIQKSKEWLSFNYRVLLSPESFFQKNSYHHSQTRQIRSYAIFSLGLSSLSWATGLYLLRPSYSPAFIFQIIFLTLAQLYILKFGLVFFGVYLESFMKKKYEIKMLALEKLELAGLCSTLPWIFFTALVGIAKSLPFSSFFVFIIYIWLSLWSLTIFVLGTQKICGLTFSQISLASLRALGVLSLFPLLAFLCFTVQLYSFTVA